jgi:25S rRNA (adenine(2142)-N(1))-methyltransferase, Bmt2
MADGRVSKKRARVEGAIGGDQAAARGSVRSGDEERVTMSDEIVAAGSKRGREGVKEANNVGETDGRVAGGGGREKRAKRPQKVRTKAIAVSKPVVQSARVARAQTTAFHALMQREAILDTAVRMGDSRAEVVKALEGVRVGLVERRHEYQAASIFATSEFKTSRWVLKGLRERGMLTDRPCDVLEVGAVNTQLLDADGVRVTAIDIVSQSPRIHACDFFDVAVPASSSSSSGRRKVGSHWPEDGRFDAVVCALVLNSVPSPVRRGEMLVRMRALLRERGLCFLVLPRRCITASPFLSPSFFHLLLAAVGFVPVSVRETPKLALWTLGRDDAGWPVAKVIECTGRRDGADVEPTRPFSPPWPSPADVSAARRSRLFAFPPQVQNPRVARRSGIASWSNAVDHAASASPTQISSATPLFAVCLE